MITILNTLAAFLIGLIIIYVKVKLQLFATKPLNQDQKTDQTQITARRK